MDYQIIATLGPSSENETIWQALLAAGATGFRLNTSHLSLAQLYTWLERLAPFLSALPTPVPLTLDLQGSKWRLGQFPTFTLQDGQTIELVQAESLEQTGVLPVPHADFFQAALVSNGEIVLNDARVLLTLDVVGVGALRAHVRKGGEISARKGITFAATEYRHEALSAKDRTILEQTSSSGLIRYAISYVKDAVEMAKYRAAATGAAYLVAKLERQPAVAQAVQLAACADELWLCRGDLGAELGLPGMAAAVHQFTAHIGELNKPAIIAGQVLEHMTAHSTPTRSEVCYLHDALLAGYRGLVLSDETAIGRYPVECCQAAGMFRNC